MLAQPKSFRRAVYVALGLVTIAAACEEAPLQPNPSSPDAALFGRGGPPTNVPVQITLGQGLGGTDAIRADDAGNTPYTEVGTASVHIASNGNLILWTGAHASQSNPPSRFVKVLTAAFDGLTSDRIFTNSHDNPGGNNSTGLLGMAVGSTGSAVVEAELGIGDDVVRYGKNCNGSANAANRVVTTHVDATHWTISGTNGVHCRKVGKTLTEVGTSGAFSMALETN